MTKYFKIKFKHAALFPKGCLTCGRDNVTVQYYLDRYVCNLCLKYLQIPTGELVQLRPSKDNRRIIAEVRRDGMVMKNIKVDIDELIIFGYKCYATFAGEKGEIIVLLYPLDEDKDK